MQDLTIAALVGATLSLIHAIRIQFRVDKLEEKIKEIEKGGDDAIS